MVVQLILAGLLVSVCAATRVQYPAKEPCILIDFVTNNSLTWTQENGTVKAIPNWNFSEFSVPEGNCSGTPYLVVLFHVDNGTVRFDFQNASGNVNVKMTLKIEPDVVFKAFNNTDNTPVEIKADLKAGTTDKSFKCNSEQKISGKKMAGKDEYAVTYRIKNLKMQGYGVVNGTYSEDIYECSADNPTTAPPNTTVTTEPTTEPVTTKPTTAPPATPPKVTLYAKDGNKTCAQVQGEFTFMIPYTTTKKAQKVANVFLPKSVNATGKCSNDNMTDTLMAMFDNGWEVDFIFKGDSDNIWLDQLDMVVVYDATNFPDIEEAKKNTSVTFSTTFSKAFKAKKDGSYLCQSDTTTNLNNGTQMKTSKFQYTALQANATTFSSNNVAECSADAKTSSIVPIAVGAALAGLVVIVLIAYLIGRRRNRKGYESV